MPPGALPWHTYRHISCANRPAQQRVLTSILATVALRFDNSELDIQLPARTTYEPTGYKCCKHARSMRKQHCNSMLQVRRAINAVGVYVPGGTAVLPSSALMLTIPAAIACCRTIVLATPPRPDGSISPEVVYCARKAGATHVLKAGGAQAVAAMGWGTQTCPKVDKIFGPGNQYVTAAKMRLQGSEAMVAIDMPAGPSEVLVIADADAPLPHVAADLLSQAEHGPDSQVRCCCATPAIMQHQRYDQAKSASAFDCAAHDRTLRLASHLFSADMPWHVLVPA